MEKSTLAEILGVEQEIRAKLDAERELASHWLEGARREIERDHEAALARLRADAELRRTRLLALAGERRAAGLAEAQAAAAAAACAGDDVLRPLVRRQLATLVPEGAR